MSEKFIGGQALDSKGAFGAVECRLCGQHGMRLCCFGSLNGVPGRLVVDKLKLEAGAVWDNEGIDDCSMASVLVDTKLSGDTARAQDLQARYLAKLDWRNDYE